MQPFQKIAVHSFTHIVDTLGWLTCGTLLSTLQTRPAQPRQAFMFTWTTNDCSLVPLVGHTWMPRLHTPGFEPGRSPIQLLTWCEVLNFTDQRDVVCPSHEGRRNYIITRLEILIIFQNLRSGCISGSRPALDSPRTSRTPAPSADTTA